MKKILGLILVAVLLGSCGLRRDVERLGTTIRSPYKGQVTILEEGSDAPEGAERVASIFIGDKGLTTKCNYDYVMADLMKTAARYGANYVILTSREKPSFWTTTCHQATALAYWVDPSLLNKQKEVKKEEKNTDE